MSRPPTTPAQRHAAVLYGVTCLKPHETEELRALHPDVAEAAAQICAETLDAIADIATAQAARCRMPRVAEAGPWEQVAALARGES
jgi:hypothetical protein